ncbi:MAG: hypothetical protein R3F39_05080 [Myxococcota bacterium]
MSAAAFLARLTAALDGAGVPYMVAGSFASTFHGTPRTTQDVDVVVVLNRQSLTQLLSSLPDDAYYVSPEAALEALQQRRQFNIIDLATGWKADLIVRKPRPFSVAEFERRIRATVLGVPVWMASAEDVVISKLEWASLGGGSERQLRDVVGVLERRPRDTVYIAGWVQRLGLDALWHEAQRLARPAGPT